MRHGMLKRLHQPAALRVLKSPSASAHTPAPLSLQFLILTTPQVARTRSRPLASGAVSVAQAVAFLGLQLSLGLAILLQLNTFTQILGASSLLLVATYPLVCVLEARLRCSFVWQACVQFHSRRNAIASGSCLRAFQFNRRPWPCCQTHLQI